MQESLCGLDGPLCILLRDMHGNTVISNVAQFEKPVEVSSACIVQPPSFDQSLVYGCNHAAVLAEVESIVEQGRCRSIEGGIIGPRSRKVEVR